MQVGVGRFQWTALAVCGLANASDAVEILGLSLVLPAAEDDLQLTAAGKSALSSCIFIGEPDCRCVVMSQDVWRA
jgi:VNT family MFS transporter (synaptic vesicle glycoprotein 2)